MWELAFEDQTAKIEAGELVSYQVDGHEFVHQKGSPGWRNSDTEMFPIIGPTAEANFIVKTQKGNAVQDQHGLLRELGYVLKQHSSTSAVFEKEYVSGTKVKNSKYPEKSSVEELFWPYDFKFIKSFELDGNGLRVTFTIEAENDMPFMLGYHPAFKLHTENPVIVTEEKTIALQEVLEAGNRAMKIPDCDIITLKDAKDLTITTKGFGNFMLWTEVPNMLCIEPITFYPYDVEQKSLDKGFVALKDGNKSFEVCLSDFTQLNENLSI